MSLKQGGVTLFHESEIPSHLQQYFQIVEPPTEPCVVGDIFAGSGSAGIAAIKLGRDFIGIDVNPQYVEMAEGALREAGAEVS